jgi:hypothetical protein
MDIYNIIRTVVRKIALVCNPCFFIFSGYLFFANIDRFNKQVYATKIRTRVSTLLIPYLLWNIIYVAVDVARVYGKQILTNDGEWATMFIKELFDKGIWNIFWHYTTWGENSVNILGWPMPAVGPFSVPLWFLQSLIILTFVLSPIIYLICKYLKLYGIIILGLIYYTNIWFTLPGFRIETIFFFSMGACWGIHKKNLIEETRRHQTFWYIIAILTLLPSVYYGNNGHNAYNYFHPISTLAMVISSINIAACLIENNKVRPNKTLSQATFFIYASHMLVHYNLLGLTFNKIFGTTSPMVLTIRYLLLPIITALFCTGMYYMIKKMMPTALKLLSGNR